MSIGLFHLVELLFPEWQHHALSQSVKNFIIAELNNHDEKTVLIRLLHPIGEKPHLWDKIAEITA